MVLVTPRPSQASVIFEEIGRASLAEAAALSRTEAVKNRYFY